MTTPAGEHEASGPRFHHGMRNAMAAYASSASTDVAAYEDLPGHHLQAVQNLIATTNDESYHGFASELPPATSHEYAEWDFSGVPDPVMFQWFVDAADYLFGYSDTSSVSSYDPACECFMVAIGDVVDDANVADAGDGENPRDLGTSTPQNPGLVHPHLANERRRHQRTASSSARARGKTRGGVPRGMPTARHHRWRSLRTR
jgi:hypothetical protein